MSSPGWHQIRQLLIDRRRMLGLGQREIANRMGGAQSMISDWETGKVTPQLDSLIAWANALEIDILVTLTFRQIVTNEWTEQVVLTRSAFDPVQ